MVWGNCHTTGELIHSNRRCVVSTDISQIKKQEHREPGLINHVWRKRGVLSKRLNPDVRPVVHYFNKCCRSNIVSV